MPDSLSNRPPNLQRRLAPSIGGAVFLRPAGDRTGTFLVTWGVGFAAFAAGPMLRSAIITRQLTVGEADLGVNPLDAWPAPLLMDGWGRGGRHPRRPFPSPEGQAGAMAKTASSASRRPKGAHAPRSPALQSRGWQLPGGITAKPWRPCAPDTRQRLLPASPRVHRPAHTPRTPWFMRLDPMTRARERGWLAGCYHAA